MSCRVLADAWLNVTFQQETMQAAELVMLGHVPGCVLQGKHSTRCPMIQQT
jgi:hypothetical protein